MRALLRLALPTSGMFFGIMLMGLVDMLFVGRLGAAALGGLGLGNSIFGWTMTVGIGVILGLDFPAAKAIGEGRPERAFGVFVQGLYLSLALSLPTVLFTVVLASQIHRFGLNAEAVPYARDFLLITAPSLLPIFLFNSAKAYLQAQSVANPTFVVLVLANLLNVALNAALIEGRFGFPELGFNGSAVSTSIGRFAMAAALIGYVFRRERRRHPELLAAKAFRIDFPLLREIVVLGVPAAAQMLLEVGVFSLSTVLAARFVATDLAAHQVVLNLASVLFMVPLGIGSAASALIGQAIGARDFRLARRTGYSALWLGLAYAVCSSAGLILLANPVLGMYTSDAAVVAAAKGILLVAALFQISDGAQAIATGALRGLGNTVLAVIANGFGHWVVGLPLGLYLGLWRDKGVVGIWMGLATGLTVVAFLLLLAWRRLVRDAESRDVWIHSATEREAVARAPREPPPVGDRRV